MLLVCCKVGMILKLHFIIIGYNSHKGPEMLKSYDSLENELRLLNEEKVGSGSSTMQQVYGALL